MTFKLISQIVFMLALVSPAHALAADLNTTSPSFDCKLASNYVESEICKNNKLALNDSVLSKVYLLFKKSKGRYTRHTIPQKEWLERRNRCKDVECINFLYVSRIKKLSEIVYWNEASYEDCAATSKCILMARHYLGVYQGSEVILDVVKISSCYKGCAEPILKYYVFERENGEIDEKTRWSGHFKNKSTKLDRRHLNSYLKNQSKSSDISTIYFGADSPGCPDCYEVTHTIVRTENGWSKKVSDANEL